MQVDLPYLEPLMLHLKSDSDLKALFGQKNFFAGPNIDLDEMSKQAEAEGRNIRYLWVYPASSKAKSQNPSSCFPIVEHTVAVVLIGSCPRGKFSWIAVDDEVKLKGTVMEMLEIRCAFKKSIQAFANNNRAQRGQGFQNLRWISDDAIDYKTGDKNSCGFISLVSKFKIDILKGV